MAKIILENMEFFAHHGVHPHEREMGNTFIVNVTMEVNTEKAGATDYLDDTVNYQIIYNTIKKQMEIPSNLLEHAVQRLVDKLMNKFPRILHVQVKLSKLNPPLGGKVQQVSVVLEKSRE